MGGGRGEGGGADAGEGGVESKEKAEERTRERMTRGSCGEEGGERNMQGKNTRRDATEVMRVLLSTEREKEIDRGNDESTAREERTMVDKRGSVEGVDIHFSLNIYLPLATSQSASTIVILWSFGCLGTTLGEKTFLAVAHSGCDVPSQEVTKQRSLPALCFHSKNSQCKSLLLGSTSRFTSSTFDHSLLAAAS